MRENCTNHQFINAHWHCKKCASSYCFECVEKKHFKFSTDETFVHICPTCKRRVEWIGINHIFDSPAKSIIQALKYPFATPSLLILLAVSCISMFFSEILVLNEILFLIIWTILLSYSTTLTESILKGQKKPPKITDIPAPMVIHHIFLVFKQALVYLIVCTLFFLSKNLENPLVSYMLIPVFAITLPFIVIKIITANTARKLFDIKSFQSVVRKSLLSYLFTSLAFIPIIAVFHLLMTYQPVLIIPFISYTILVIHKLLGEITLLCNKELKHSIDYENFKDMYTLESLHGFRT